MTWQPLTIFEATSLSPPSTPILHSHSQLPFAGIIKFMHFNLSLVAVTSFLALVFQMLTSLASHEYREALVRSKPLA